MVNFLFKHLAKKVCQMNRFAKRLLIVTNFSLANCRPFAKLAKLSTRQTSHDMVYMRYNWNDTIRDMWKWHTVYVVHLEVILASIAKFDVHQHCL